MDPRPNATNIRAVDRHLYERLSTIPSYQSAMIGYAGMAKKVKLYALDSTVPWVDFENPGPVRQGTDGSLDAGSQRNQQAIYDGCVAIFTSQANVKRAIIAALNLCVPKKYRCVDGGIGALHYKCNQCPRTILDHLRNMYGRPTPREKTIKEGNWVAAYNPNEPIEDLYDRLEECFVVALVYKPAYTMD